MSLHLTGQKRDIRPPLGMAALPLEHIPALASTIGERFPHNNFNIFQMAAWMDSSPGRIYTRG